MCHLISDLKQFYIFFIEEKEVTSEFNVYEYLAPGNRKKKYYVTEIMLLLKTTK